MLRIWPYLGGTIREILALFRSDGHIPNPIAAKGATRRRLWIIPPFIAVLLLIGFLILRWRARRARGAPRESARRDWPDISELQGLSEADVAERQLKGQTNVGVARISPSRNDIWRRNLFSIFNLNLIGLGIALLLLGKPLDALTSVAGALFGIVMNVRQQLVAKAQVDEIAASTRAEALVVREGEVKSIPPDQIVLGDVLLVGPGDPVFADGQLTGRGQIRVDESAITGNADRPVKRAGDSLYAGSYCVAGRVAYTVRKVGDDRMAAKLITAEKGTYTDLTPLQTLMNRALRVLLVVVAIFVVGLMAVYLFSGVDRLDQFFIDAVSMAFGIAPSGLFFMFIITYAVATASIAKLGAVVYRPQAVEALAYVDVICLGKTSGLVGISVEVEPIDQPGEAEGLTAAQVRRALGDYAHSIATASPIIRAIADTFTGDRRPTVTEAPFFSAYGWSAVAFDETDLRGVYVLGEAETLGPFLKAEARGSTTGEEETEEDESRLSAVTSIGKRLTGLLRRGEKEDRQDVEDQLQRVEQTGAQGADARLTGEEAVPRSSSEVEGESESDGHLAEPETKRWSSRIRALTQQAKTLLQRRDGDDQPSTEDKAREDEAREIARLLFAYVPDIVTLQEAGGLPKLPAGLIPLCHLRLVEYVREEAKATIQAFAQQGVAIKLLSSDRTGDVAQVARQAGLTEAEGAPVCAVSGPDLAALDEEGYAGTNGRHRADAARSRPSRGDGGRWHQPHWRAEERQPEDNGPERQPDCPQRRRHRVAG
jgi:magnesium-transporting ATPase (P-type)